MITLNFDEVLKRIYNAKKGVEVRYGLGQGFEYCKQFADEAQGHATNAKASADKAAQTVAGIEQTKTDAVQAVQNAQSTATTAVTTKQTEAVQAVDDERDAALQQVADSTRAAQTAANAAGNAATAAGGYASNAESSATAASSSASAAATSESNAASSAQSAGTDADRAEAAAALAGTRANTDKTLKTENAPADAAAVGNIILDPDGNAIFYSKAEVEAKIKEILAAQREEDLARIKFWVSDGPTSPASFIGGTWERIEGKFIMGASDTYPAGSTGGNLQMILSPENIPAVGFVIPTNDTQKNDIHVGKWDFMASVSQETTDGGRYHSGLYSSTNNGNSPVDILNPYYSMYIWRRVA
uniref:phage baseplate protein n=1 Tax=Faecalibacterium sp. TaxID=1971605 RepID=UPI003FED4DD5